MSRLFYLVLIVSVLKTSIATWFSADLCRQDSDACATIRAINETITNLLQLLKNKEYGDCQVCNNLLEAEVVINLDDFYVEMTKYEAIFKDLHFSRMAYMNSSEWHNLNSSAAHRYEEMRYSSRLQNIRSYTAHLVQELKMKFSVPNTLPSPTVAPQNRPLSFIYSETNFVINKMRKILPNCRVCVARRMLHQ